MEHIFDFLDDILWPLCAIGWIVAAIVVAVNAKRNMRNWRKHPIGERQNGTTETD